jgi:response regulator RpfG family c-di-GMP phosphodiesterase
MIRLLFVDDDPAIRRVFQRLFPRPTYQVDVADSGLAGLQLLEENDYDAIISDYRMPRMDGGEFLARACDRRPDATRILVTAESDFEVAVRAVNRGEVFRMVRKPWDEDALHFAVRSGLEVRRMRREREEMLRSLQHKTASLARLNQDLAGLNHQLEVRVHDRSRVIVDSLVTALSFRDPDASGRARRLAAIARRLGEQLGLSGGPLDDVEQGALLHDVGRLAIRDELFFKRGPLSDEEWGELRRHPEAGHRLLSRIEFLEEARRIVLHHRERFDGSGYPMGLHGDAIAPGARIFAVAEVVEAALSEGAAERPADAPALAPVHEELARGAGAGFDPEVVAAFAAVPAWQWEGVITAPSSAGDVMLLEVA